MKIFQFIKTYSAALGFITPFTRIDTTTTTNNNNNNNSVALVRERTIPTERPLLIGEGSANFCG
jgi:hypothetical protein